LGLGWNGVAGREIKNQASKIKNTYKNSKMSTGNFADKYRTPA
jgi:hypothetical protein